MHDVGASRLSLSRGIGLVRTQDDRDIDAQTPKVRHPKQGDALVRVVVCVDQKDDIAFADLGSEGVPFLERG